MFKTVIDSSILTTLGTALGLVLLDLFLGILSNSTVKKVVTVIPVKPTEVVKGFALGAKKRVAAYCRVSTDLKEQETSFESQVQHYTDTIGKRTDWDLADIYADDGISGTRQQRELSF